MSSCLAKDLGAHLLMGYFDVNLKDYRFIPVAFNRRCLGDIGEELKALIDLGLDYPIEVIEERIKPYVLTLNDLDKIFK